MSRMIVFSMALLLATAACDSGTSDATESTDVSTTNPIVRSTTSLVGDDTTTSVASEDATTTTAVVEAFEFFLPMIDVPEIDQLTPTTGVGGRPLIEWGGHDGASAYEMTVFGPGGTIYWSVVGPETSIYLGGGPASNQSPGPQIQDGMSWAVVALDANGHVIAQSRIRPIAP